MYRYYWPRKEQLWPECSLEISQGDWTVSSHTFTKNTNIVDFRDNRNRQHARGLQIYKQFSYKGVSCRYYTALFTEKR